MAVITNVGPVHVELLGSVEAIAAAKAEVLEALPADGAAPWSRSTRAPSSRFLDAAPATCCASAPAATSRRPRCGWSKGVTEALVATPAGEQLFHFPFAEAHNLTNALAAIAAGVALGVAPGGYGRRRCRA